MDWMEELVGIPYCDGGLTLNGFDCYGLVRYVVRKGLEIELPEKPLGWRRYGAVLPPSTHVQRYDILFFSRRTDRMVDHVGIALSPVDFIHANEISEQVVCEPIDRVRRKLKAIGRITVVIKK